MTQTAVVDVAVLIILGHLLFMIGVPAVLTIVAVRGLTSLNRKLPTIMPQVQGYARQLADKSEEIGDRVKDPIIAVETTRARQRARAERATAPLRRQLDKWFPTSLPQEDSDGRIS